MLINDLQKIDFSRGEAQIYLAALELGEASMQRIAKKACIKRTTAYGLADTLKERGLLSVARYKGNRLYYAENPKKIAHLIKEKEKTFEATLPELLSITNLLNNKPTIRYFEGKNVTKDIYNEALQYPGQQINEWCSEKTFLHNDTHDWLNNFFMPERIKNKIFTKIITQENKRTKAFQKKDKNFLRETRLDRSADRIFENNILLFGTKNIAISSPDEMMSFVIESKSLHKTLNCIFEVYWESIEN